MTSKRLRGHLPEYLRLIFRQIPGVIWATDRDLRFRYVNGRTHMLDTTKAEQLVGESVYRFVGSRDPTEPVVANHLAALAGSHQAFQYARNGHTFEVIIEPMHNDDGSIVGCVGAAVDVTERQAAQARLARSEAQLAEAQQLAHVGSFEWDVRDDVVTCSPELRRIYGVTAEPGIRTLGDLLSKVHADDRDRVREALFDAVRHLAPFEYDHRVVRPDGDVRVLHTVGAGVGDQGSPRRLVGSCWDVTVHHATTERLRHSVSLLEATLDATADGILVVDAERRVTAHNRRFLEMWRVPASLASGSDNVLLSRVSELLEDPAGFREGVRQLYDAPAREGFDVLRFKDGRVFERYSRPQRIGSRIVGRVWSFRDVSEREHLVQRSTFLADAARLLASLDADKALQDVARLAVPYLGRQCIIDVQRDGTWHRLFGAPEDGSPVPPPDLHPRVADGHSIRYAAGSRSIVAVPLLSRDAVIGAITAVAGPGRIYDGKDLTLLEELASRMALSLDNARLFEGARHAVASRDEFLSIAAHEIRGPLTSIHLAVQALLRNSLSGDGARAALETIQREDRRVGRFVDDLLDLGRMRSGQLHLALEEVDLGTIVRDVISHLAGDFAQAGSEATVTTSGELVGHWDPVRLEQVVTNLVSNAIKFGEGKPIDVTAEGAHGRARLRVTDHGIGIAADRLARIFDRFERAVDARHYGGLGLGLHIAKTIVNGLGGTLTVESQPGCGSTFTVELPLVREEER